MFAPALPLSAARAALLMSLVVIVPFLICLDVITVLAAARLGCNLDYDKLHDRDIPLLRRKVGVVFQDFKLLPRKTQVHWTVPKDRFHLPHHGKSEFKDATVEVSTTAEPAVLTAPGECGTSGLGS